MTRRVVTAAQWRPILGMAGFILLLHVAGWGTLAGLVASGHLLAGSGGVFGLGLGLTAYTLGMRHDLGDVGFLMVGLFAAAWVVAIAVWRFGRIEERWSGA